MMHTATNKNFKALVDASRRAGRLDEPTKEEPRESWVQAGLRLAPGELEQARQLAAEEDRSGSSFIRRTYLRGLELVMAERGQKTVAQ